MTKNTWTKSTYSANTGAYCLEVRHNSDNSVSVRDSKNPDGGQLELSADSWSEFVEFAKNN